MATYYVSSSDGSDSNDGLSSDAAWETLSKVNGGSYSAGDQILFKRGDVWYGNYLNMGSNDGASGNPIVLSTYGSGAKPRLSACQEISGNTWADQGSNVWSTSYTPGEQDPNICIFDGTIGTKQASSAAVTSAGDWYFDTTPDTLYVYSTSDPSTAYATVEIGYWNDPCDLVIDNYFTFDNLHFHGGNHFRCLTIAGCTGLLFTECDITQFYGDGCEISQATNDVTFVDCYIDPGFDHGVDIGFHGIQTLNTGANQVTNIYIYGCEVTGMSGDGVNLANQNTGNRGDGAVVQGLYSHGNGGAGLYITWYDNVDVLNCRLVDNGNVITSWTGAEPYGIGVRSSSSINIIGCTLRDNAIDGIELWGGNDATDGTTDSVDMWQNDISGNGGEGIKITTAYVTNCDFAYNRITGNTQNGIYEGGTGAARRYINNTTYDNGFDEMRLVSCANVTLRNNIFMAVSGQQCLDDINNNATLTAHTNNCYYKATGTVVHFASTDYTYSDVVSSWEATAVRDDPRLADPPEYLRLSPDSPCVNAGVAVSGVTLGYGTIDLGCEEYWPLDFHDTRHDYGRGRLRGDKR